MCLLILCLHDLDGVNLLSMFLEGCCILKPLSTLQTSNRYLQDVDGYASACSPCSFVGMHTTDTDNLCDPWGDLFAQDGHVRE